ncbi:MAG: dUTP diphosphatase [Clostridia bacterium]|nr:dUTP diphosphatase [Clostridia bacterium]
MIEIRTKKLRPGAVLPKLYSAGAAGADLCACIEDTVGIPSGETVAIPTGLAVEIPEGYAGLIFARSGLAVSQGIAPANKVGLIDSDYRGELILQLHNHSDTIRTVEPGQRLAQMVIMPVAAAVYVEAESLSETERGSGGFGSTGQF